MTVHMFEKKTATIDITVEENGVAKDISAGTPRAVMQAPGAGKKTLTAVLTGVAGVVQVTIPKAAVDIHGSWLGECALLLGDDDRTIWQEDILAKQSIL